jgi:hypothetical protein
MDFEFELDADATLIATAVAEMLSSFEMSTQAASILSGASSMTFLFVMTTDGGLLWVPIDAGSSSESWSDITHTGDTWSEVSTGGTIETWTEMVK